VRSALLLIAIAACGGERAAPRPIRFLHTFGARETELLNALMAERGIAVDPSLVPFARGQQVIGEILRAGTACPDLIRIDATWLASVGPLTTAPPELASLDWLPEAVTLATAEPGNKSYAAIPQAVDGLVVIRDNATPAPISPAIVDLVGAVRAARHSGRPHPLGVRVDGYWLLPWLRAEGIDLGIDADGTPMIGRDGAARAVQAFASLFGELAPPPPPAGGEAPDEIRRWTGHEIAYWITGPWQVGALGARDHLAVSALAHAPRGGQLLVVPQCAKRPDEGWKLAAVLTSVDVQRAFAQRFATVPSRGSALDGSPQLVHDLYAALRAAEPLPRSPLTPLLFDDLNPALAAVVYGDATPEEAVAGAARGWRRIAEQRK
jgi:ABC-type glycerol-3-phosphate transport system substrate-binding protein